MGKRFVKSWVEYWDGDHPIYVNERHKTLHYQRLVRDFAAHIPSPAAHVLDYGCGDAWGAEALARLCGTLTLSDAAPNVREKLAARLAGRDKIHVLSPEAVLEGEYDLILLNSIAQYIEKPAFAALIAELAARLKPGGRLIVGDILPPNLSAITDALALLRFGFEGGFLIPAILGLVRTALSDYRKLRADLGLSTYTEAEMLGVLEGAGLSATRLPHNPGHNQARMAFCGVKA
jgi:SAM-dependent methyltransferase